MCPTYIFGPSFRSDPSVTRLHACEFFHYEPEIPFITLEGLMDIEETTLRSLIRYILQDASVLDGLKYLKKDLDPLKTLVDESFERISYTQAIKILRKCDEKFEKDISWGEDLRKEHWQMLYEDLASLLAVETGKCVCSACDHGEIYTTGDDEYPPRTAIAYCMKGHWENSDPYDPILDEEIKCKDFQVSPLRNKI